jgi:bifunctional non-homologous end joining protein LigD
MTEAKKIGMKTPFPNDVQPMLAVLTKEPFDDDDYTYEVKWDGYRIISHVNKKSVVLKSRSLQNYTKKYPPIAQALKDISHNMVLDGEVVVMKDGLPSFSNLQNYREGDDILYYVFDLLWIDGYDIKEATLTERRTLLQEVIPLNDYIKFSESFDNGTQLYDLMKGKGMEGIIAKRKTSSYRPGKRDKSWLKIPILNRQEYVIGGWTESENGRDYRSLLFGNFREGKLHYVHHTSGGMSEIEVRKLSKQLKKIEIKKSPFINEQDVEAETSIHWVKPIIVGQFEQTNKITESGKIRHPVIMIGVREDKKPEEITAEPGEPKNRIVKKKSQIKDRKESNWRIIKQEKTESKSILNIGGEEVTIKNPDKEIWRGIVKAELVKYYVDISEYILPYLNNRPLSLHIKHVNAYEKGFYIKDMEGNQPAWAEVFNDKRKHKEPGRRDEIDYLVCNKLSTLLFAINLGAIDLNPWHSTVLNANEPDYLIIDLDPSDKQFGKVIRTAQFARKVLVTKYKLKAFPKTSGKTGLHIYIPCVGFDYKAARSISKKLCEEINGLAPDLTTMAENISSRGTKVFLDYTQNDYADTIASAYSLRPHHQPYVSAPLEWREIKEDLKPETFNIHTMPQRIEEKGDLFKGVLTKENQQKNSIILRKFLH